MNDTPVKTAADKLKTGTEKDLTGRAVNENQLQRDGRVDKLKGEVRDPLDAVADAADKATHPPMTR